MFFSRARHEFLKLLWNTQRVYLYFYGGTKKEFILLLRNKDTVHSSTVEQAQSSYFYCGEQGKSSYFYGGTRTQFILLCWNKLRVLTSTGGNKERVHTSTVEQGKSSYFYVGTKQ